MSDIKKTVLIDGDQISYTAAFSCEKEIKWDEDTWSLTSSETDLKSTLNHLIEKAKADTGAAEYKLALSSPKLFRKDLYPDYKANRTNRKPLGLKFCHQYLTEEHGAEIHDGFEADDLLGIWACKQNDKIIWAADKDFFTVPCFLYRNDRLHRITESDADRYLRLQTMIGDTIDNYKGAKGFGEKTAEKWLNKWGDSWDSVYRAFQKAGQSNDEFRTNAKLARILRSFDDIKWEPAL